jgi:competence protein ComEA
MAQISRSQLLVYGAIAVVVLLLGARWVSASEGDTATDGQPAFTSGSGAAGTLDAGGRAGGQDAEAGTNSATGPLVEAGDRDALVHVTGAVRKPGVYRLPLGARVADALERAGGAAARAEISAINLAARLSDGQQIVVPTRARSSSGGRAPAAGTVGVPVTPDGGPISLGSASSAELESIDGIGPVTAAAIIAFRDERGGLASIDELDEVSGIGPATLDALRARLQP